MHGVGARWSGYCIGNTQHPVVHRYLADVRQSVPAKISGRLERILLNDEVVEAGSPFEPNKGDVLVIELPGGGGFGPAEQRDSQLLEADQKDGLL